ncbi:MAG: HNH endonuclease signature motif containing protein [Nocardioides sp.]
MSQAASTVFGVDDLGPDALLAALTDADRRERQAARDKLLLAYQWCVLHPATADTGVATWGSSGDLDADESLGGDGTPMVAAFAPEPLGLALGVPTSAAMTLIADALDLVYRLPQTWRRVQSLEVPAWRGSRVAQRTHTLTEEAAAHVDCTLAPRLHTVGVLVIDRTVAQAIATYMPDEHQTREERAKATWDVTLHHPDPTEFAGTSELQVVGDTMTLTNLYHQICVTAADLKTHGDPDYLGARKVKSLRQLAGTPTTKLYLHLDLADLDDAVHVGHVEKLGPATTATIKDWVGHSRATIQPVLRMDRDDALDTHDPPGWMRDLVILRDPTWVFPHCQRDSRACDLDHTTAYDEHGPPGQTTPANLAPLCRRHHRAKTTGRWTYQRLPDGSYEWHS